MSTWRPALSSWSLRQLIMTGIGAGISYVIFATAQESASAKRAAALRLLVASAHRRRLLVHENQRLEPLQHDSHRDRKREQAEPTLLEPARRLPLINLITRQTAKIVDEASAKAATDMAG